MNKYWSIKNTAEDSAEIFIYGQIGKNWWDDSGVGAKDFITDLKALGNVKTIDLRVNSEGGSVFEGLAIYNTLKSHPAEINGYVDGLAASIASVLLMACDKVIMPENALMMIHNPTGEVYGEAEDMRKMADALEKVKSGILSAYRDKTGLDDEEVSSLMNEETYMLAAEALEKGFIDEVSGAVKIAANLDFSKFKNMPEEIKNLLENNQIEDKSQSSFENNSQPTKIEKPKPKSKNKKEEVVIIMEDELEKAGENAATAENNRASEILDMGTKFKCSDLAMSAVKNKTSIEDFKTIVMDKIGAKPTDTVNPLIGMNNSETEEYSVVRAIRNMANFKPIDGLEKEVSDAAAKVVGREAKGFFIPHDIMKKQIVNSIGGVLNGLESGDATKGGYVVGTEVRTNDMIELLRNKMLLADMGATSLTGLVGNIAIPKIGGGATAYWLPETGDITPSEQSFKQLGLVPHRLGADTAYSKELVNQTSLAVESFVRGDLMSVLAIERDRAGINGSGNDGQPLGLMNVDGIGSVTFGAAPTWQKVVDFETALANSNADLGAMGYLTTPSVRGKWKTTVKVANTAHFLWENGSQPGSGMANGYRAEATKQVPDNKVIFGNFSDLILAEWAGVDVVVDPYSLKKTGQIEVTITIWVDNGVRHEGSFAVSSDSGAQ